MLTLDQATLRQRGRRLTRSFPPPLLKKIECTLKEDVSQVGGGALPLQDLPTLVLAIKSVGFSVNALEEKLRKGEPPVVARISRDELILDLRTVSDEEIPVLARRLGEAIEDLGC